MRRQHELFCCRLCLQHLQVCPQRPRREPRRWVVLGMWSHGWEGLVHLLLLALDGPQGSGCTWQGGFWWLAGPSPAPCCSAAGLWEEAGGLGSPSLCPAPCALQIFTYERKWYSRKDLARHRMQGDPDDTSHRGHPLCKFCDERYLDNDELLKHLRRDHYFCHFCDSDGAQDYYRWAGRQTDR